MLRLLTALALALVTTVAASSATNHIVALHADVRSTIRIRTLLSATPVHGFAPIEIHIDNNSQTTRTWRFRFEIGDWSRRTSVGSVTCRTEPGRSASWKVFVPLVSFDAGASLLWAHVEGPGVEAPQVSLSSRGYMTGHPPFIAITQALHAEHWSRLEGHLNPGAGASPRPTVELLGGPVDLQELVPDWRSLSGVDVLAIQPSDWDRLPPQHREMVRLWIAQGGHLAVIAPEPTTLPGLPAPHTSPAAFGLGRLHNVPTESITPLRADIAALAAALPSPATSAHPRVDDYAPHSWKLLGALPSRGDVAPLLLTLAIAFAGIMGPLNFAVFAPARRRERLFISVPAIALLGALVLVGIILVKDGLGGTGHRSVLVVTVPGSPAHVVIQEQVTRTGLLAGTTSPLDSTTAALFIPTSTASGPQEARALGRDDTRLFGSWFASRSDNALALRTILPSRAGVDIDAGPEVEIGSPAGPQAGQAPVATSTFGSAITGFVYRDAAGKLWTAERLSPGARVPLLPAPPEMTARSLPAAATGLGSLHRISSNRQLLPGEYHGLLDGDAALPIPTLGSIRWTEDAILVLGQARTRSP